MQAWQSSFKEIQEQYLKNSRERVSNLIELLSLVHQDPENYQLLKKLSHHFHVLAGSGTMYGFPKVSQLGLEGEKFCDQYTAKSYSTNLKPINVEKLKEIINGIVASFEHSSSGSGNTSSSDTLNLIGNTQKKASSKSIILFVCDNPEESMLIKEPLAKLPCELIIITTLDQALNELRKNKISALILKLPHISGDVYDFVEKIRSHEVLKDLPVLFVSDRAEFLDKVRSIHCGADGHFDFSLNQQAFTNRLMHLLKKQSRDPYKIMSVEDDIDQAAFIRVFLESVGYQVKTCPHPKDFENTLSSFQPDLVLLDVNLPEVNGYELAKYLRQDERYATLPILFLTTESKLEARVESALSGADDHLVKPVPPALLLSSVSAKLERSSFLKSLLQKDALTQLLNHSALMEFAKKLISKSTRANQSLVLIMFDIDFMKLVNEKYGFTTGDRVLNNLANLLKKRVRQSDVVARYGLDEFAIIAEGINPEESLALSNRIVKEFSSIKQSIANQPGFFVTISAGISLFDPKGMNLVKWFESANSALKTAKTSGRNQVVVYDGAKTDFSLFS